MEQKWKGISRLHELSKEQRLIESDQLVRETLKRLRGQKKFNYVLGPI